MIKYALKCTRDHHFDAWFNSSSSFDQQESAQMISCPTCGDSGITKALMTPSLATSGHLNDSPKKADNPALDDKPAHEADTKQDIDLNTMDVPGVSIPEPLLHGNATVNAVLNKMRELRGWVEQNATNVGDEFASEVRKIHYQEEDDTSNIFGKATFDEVQELIDEGIHFMPLPALPEDNH